MLTGLLAACSMLQPAEQPPPSEAPVAESLPPASTQTAARPELRTPKPRTQPPPAEPALLDPVPATAEDRRCLAQTIYFEARGEPLAGQKAVAKVVLNRVRHGDFPDTICAVVRQGGERPLGSCQFSWWCDGRSDKPRAGEAWRRAQTLAAELTTERHDAFDGALYFHNIRVRPSWSYRLERVARIGDHIYYR
jgi:spore germination cell wall hydrolase CwlJ-like protein